MTRLRLRHLYRGAVAALAGLMLSYASCSKREPFVPPDPFYLFATYTVGKNPTSVTAADFNQDGLTDLVTTNIGSNSLSILFGNGDGSFNEAIQIEAHREPRAVVVEDFNRDGYLDMAVACSGSDQIVLFFGSAKGRFRIGQRYSVMRTPVSLASADFNGDRNPDLVVALRNDKIKVFLGRGDGSFAEGVQYEYGDTPTSLAQADFNGDGNPDLAVTNGGPMSSAVSIWIGNGDGTFRAPTDYRTGKRPLAVTFGDFNVDGNVDLFVINGEMDTVTTFLGNGKGAFDRMKESGADQGPTNGLVHDFNEDRLPDVAIVNIQSSNLSILYGQGDGSFRYPPRNYRTKGGPFALTMVTLTNNSSDAQALVIANNGASSISIFLPQAIGSRASSSHPGPT